MTLRLFIIVLGLTLWFSNAAVARDGTIIALEQDLTTIESVYPLLADARVLQNLNTALARNGCHIQKITFQGTRGNVTYKFILAPAVKPPPGIHGNGYFTVTRRAGPDDRPIITDVSGLVFERSL